MNANSFRTSVILSLTLLSLSLMTPACSPANTPTPTAIPPTETEAPLASLTPEPTFPPPPTPTLFMTSTPTLEPTATITATPLPPPDDFSNVKLIGYGPLPDWRFMFTFQFTDLVKGDYYVETANPKKTYPCRPETEYRHPERLVCIGYTPAVEKPVQFSLINAKTGQVVFPGVIAVPFK